MSQPTTDRSTLAAFLPQFADPSGEPITPATILNGESTTVNGKHTVEHESLSELNGVNGHAVEMFSEMPAASRISDSDFLAAESSNGAGDDVVLDQLEVQPEVGLNGHGQDHLNGTAQYVSALDPVADAVRESAAETITPDTVVIDRSDVVIGDRPLPSAEIEQASAGQVSEPTVASPRLQESRPEHPASGSMFTPYLVTEIRELRNRSNRRRSWWRRLFG